MLNEKLEIKHYFNDMPHDIEFTDGVAIDTETMGLNLHRDRLCLVQLSAGDGVCHLVQFDKQSLLDGLSGKRHDIAKNLCKLLNNPKVVKIFHFARFDIGILTKTFAVEINNIYCTKIASFLGRTFTSSHGLKDLCKDLLGIELSKQEQTSDWGQEILLPEQLEYAATDVLYLHALKDKLDKILIREDRYNLFKQCCQFLPTRVKLDLLSGEKFDVFSHSIDRNNN